MQQIIVQAQPGGYLLILKPSEYDTLVSIGAFKGIKVSYDIDPSSGNYQMKLNSADWSVFQVNLGATEGGAYTLKLTPAQFEEFKTIGFFNNLKIQAAVQPNGDYVINLNPEEYKIFQENQKKAKSAPQAAVPEDSISVTQDPSGKFVLQIPEPVWKIILQNKGFEGIKPTPDPKPNPDGSRTVKLTPAQWKTFQDNQKKPPIPVPVEPEPGKEPSDKPSEKPSDDSISVTKEPSGEFALRIPAALWKIIQINQKFEGIDPKPAEPNPDNSFTIKMTPDEYATFKINMEKPVTLAPLERPMTGRKPSISDKPQDNITVQREPSGKYNLQVPASLMKILDINNKFDDVKPKPRPVKNDDGTYTIILTITQWQQFQESIKKPAMISNLLEVVTEKPSTEIAVNEEPSGKFVLQIPETVWAVLVEKKRFEGIKPTPDPKPNPDGSRTVKLTPAQWKTFQDNQKKPPIPVPVEPEPGKKPSDKPADEISVTKDPSGKFILQIPAHLWTIILQNKGLEGIKPIPTPKPNPDGSRTVTLTPAQWQTFQDNQKKPPIAIPDKPEPGKEPTDSISVI